MSDASLIALYSDKLLSLAANMPLTDPLVNPDGAAKLRSPLCGSNIEVEIQTDGIGLTAYHQDVKACALGQASASVFASNAIGLSYAKLVELRDQMMVMLKENGPAPDGQFENLRYLLAARDFKNRHDSIMLVFNATIEAFDQAQKKASA